MMSDAQKIGELLQGCGGILATAESCTGGLVAECITKIPGASLWFAGGWVTYSDEMKQTQLGVDSALIESHGAVSRQVAKAMCEGVLKESAATVCLSTTGIAGPSGGTDEKPVGTVFIGCLYNGVTEVHAFLFSGSRDEIRQQAASSALQIVRLVLQGEPLQ